MATYNALTPEEISFIRGGTNNMSIAEIAQALGRSYSCVQARFNKEGVWKTHRWTRDEDAILCSNYKRIPTCELAASLNLQVQQIYNRIRQLRRRGKFPKFFR